MFATMFRRPKKEKPHSSADVGASHDTFSHVRENIIGHGHVIDGPVGPRRLLYADYVASGRAYGPIEDTIRDHVLPLYANTHTESSMTGRQTTAYREQARGIIANALGAGEDDAVIFCGSGCTGAIDKLIGILRLKFPAGISKYGVDTRINAANRPVVFIGPFEHHSNDVQWRETIADVVTIAETKDGLLDLADLEKNLKKYRNRPLKIGSFSVASNVTGILVDPVPVAKLLHRYGALAAFDGAAAAPYIDINMNAPDGAHMDALFISPHKFIGGPGTPGLLVLKKKWAQNKTPVVPGGGTVSYVSPCAQSYLDDTQHREEGGTPDIVGAIRTGLAFNLRDEVGIDKIADHEKRFAKRALERWGRHKNIKILGSNTAERLPVFSFLIRCKTRYLHYNFVVAVLNDYFGIQSRGGCSCAGPYGHRLLEIDLETSRQYEDVISAGAEVLKPGWVRVGFNYFCGPDEVELLLGAVEWVAEHGYKLLPLYDFETRTGLWSHKQAGEIQTLDLLADEQPILETPPADLGTLIQLVNADIQKAEPSEGQPCCAMLNAAPKHLHWFSV